MKKCDLFVLSSASEAMPYALLEALLLSPRVVATSCPGGVAETLRSCGGGRLVLVGDEVDLANAMIVSLRESARKISEDFFAQFDETVIADKYWQIFTSG